MENAHMTQNAHIYMIVTFTKKKMLAKLWLKQLAGSEVN